VDKTVENLRKLGVDPGDIKAVGITNQRETIIAWDKLTGEPLYNAIGNDIFVKLIISLC
jgi:glycerol kinase